MKNQIQLIASLFKGHKARIEKTAWKIADVKEEDAPSIREDMRRVVLVLSEPGTDTPLINVEVHPDKLLSNHGSPFNILFDWGKEITIYP